MGSDNNNRDPENINPVENHAGVHGDGNEVKQAGGPIVEGDYNQFPDEGRVKTDFFTIFSDISFSLGRSLFKLGIGDRLERLSLPSAGLLAVFLATLLGSNIYAASDLTGAGGMLVAIAVYAYSQVTEPLLRIAADRPAIGLVLLAFVALPIWYEWEKFTSTCGRCDRPFAAMTRMIEYPSRTSYDQEGNPHVPVDSDRFCIYCDGDAEVVDDTPSDDEGESAPQIMADGGGDDDAGACSCSCHNQN